MAMSWLAPSASATSWRARLGADLGDGRGELVGDDGATPEAPDARSTTVSLVDMQPSESTRSKVVRGRGPQRGVERARVDDGVGGDDAEHRRQRRARACPRPWPCRRPSSPAREAAACLGDGVGRHDRVRGVVAAVGGERGGGSVDSRERSCPWAGSSPIRPVEQTTTSPARDAERRRRRARRCGGVSAKPCGAGAGVGAAGVEHDRVDPAVGDDLPRPRRPGRPRRGCS